MEELLLHEVASPSQGSTNRAPVRPFPPNISRVLDYLDWEIGLLYTTFDCSSFLHVEVCGGLKLF